MVLQKLQDPHRSFYAETWHYDGKLARVHRQDERIFLCRVICEVHLRVQTDRSSPLGDETRREQDRWQLLDGKGATRILPPYAWCHFNIASELARTHTLHAKCCNPAAFSACIVYLLRNTCFRTHTKAYGLQGVVPPPVTRSRGKVRLQTQAVTASYLLAGQTCAGGSCSP